MNRLSMLAFGAMLILPATTFAQGTDDVFKIGVLTDMSSVFADNTGAGSVAAARMAVADFGGTVLGRRIEVVAADHQNKADVGSSVARQWLDADKVEAIVDVPNSSVAFAVQQIAKDKNRVLLISGGGSSDLTGKSCTATSVQWTYDTYALSKVAGSSLIKRGANSWFFITADYAFGHALERDAGAEVARAGGTVLGSVRAPLGTSDFSSFLVQAQGSKAKVVALANAGGDTITAVKQASEFGVVRAGQQIIALNISSDETHSIGLNLAQGLLLTEAWYWDLSDATRGFASRFREQMKLMPTMYQAGVYSAVSHYLKAVKAAGGDEAKAVVAKMRDLPVNDMFATRGRVREDGRMVHDMYLMQVKTPAESSGEWDMYKLLATVPGDEAYRPMSEGGCPLVQK